jgi:superfamily I DNA/RNA helicase
MALPESSRPNPDYMIESVEQSAGEYIDRVCAYFGIRMQEFVSTRNYHSRRDKELINIQLPLQNIKASNKEKIWHYLLKGSKKLNHPASLTFQMIMVLAIYIIKSSPKIKKALQMTYSHVFLDEFQDTTDLQYNLLTTCFKESTAEIIAVGDKKQRIMLWANALPNAFEIFQQDFHSSYVVFEENHRSVPKLIELQKMMYNSLNASADKAIAGGNWNEEDGYIAFVKTKQEDDECNYVVFKIEEYIESGIDPCKISIIVRERPQNYAEKIRQNLSKKNIYARYEADYVDLLKNPIICFFTDFLAILLNESASNEWMSATAFAINVLDIESQNEKKYYDFMKGWSKLIQKLKKEIRKIKKIEELQLIFAELFSLVSIDSIKKSFPAFAQDRAWNDMMNKFYDLYWRNVNLVQSFSEGLDYFLGKASIPIMTIHKSKGSEYNVVFFLGLEDQAFRNFASRSEEERCNFFVALSRAKTDLIFTYCEHRGPQNFSRNHTEINEFHELLNNSSLVDSFDYS